MDRYIKEEKIGEGTYAVVYKGLDKETGRCVAVKKIRMGHHRDGIHFSAIREIKFFQELHHTNIVRLWDVYQHKTNLYLVLEYLETDLEAVIKDKTIVFTAAHIKSWMWMILQAVEFCHHHHILHRDLKPNNLLIGSDGILKLADFGLMRHSASPNRAMTSQIVTRWYRAPELLLGSRYYDGGIDIWAVGCIFAELMLRTPYLPGESDIEQVGLIFKALGSPTEESWPDLKHLPDYVTFKTVPKTPLKHLFTAASQDALDLLEKMLTMNPCERITATEALMHPYFRNEPSPTLPPQLPRPKLKHPQKHGSSNLS